MKPLSSPRQYLFNLKTTSSQEAVRMWTDFTKNVVCCCHSCNQSKSHSPWEEWYFSQDFFSMKNYNKIINWMKPDPPQNLFTYRPRRNNAT